VFVRPNNDASIIVVVIDDSADDDVASVVAREDRVPSPRFAGAWGAMESDGDRLITFRLVELAGGIERLWSTGNIDWMLLDAILDVPHLVAVMPEEIAGDATTVEDMLPRLGGSLMVEVQDASPQVAQVLADQQDE
jgi:hypothetical protein